MAVLAGMATGSASLAGLSTLSRESNESPWSDRDESEATTEVSTDSRLADRRDDPKDLTVEADKRILAIPVDIIGLPVAVDDRIELVGLEPTLAAVEAEVVAADARVIGLTDDSVLVVVTAEEAYRAAEFEAVGSLSVLGRSMSNPGTDR